MTGKDKDEIIQVITECFESHDRKVSRAETKRANVQKLQDLFDQLVSLWKYVQDNPHYKLDQYTSIEALSRHALNMVELDKYIQEQSQAIIQEEEQ